MLSYAKKILVRLFPRSLILPIAELTAVELNRTNALDAVSDIFDKHGFHLLRKHYYLPIPEKADLDENFWNTQSELVGMEMNEAEELNLLRNIFPRYVAEFRDRFPVHQPQYANQFYLLNANFMAIDAHVYYMFIRHFKPKRIIEIGSGFSTLLAASCIGKLKDDGEAAPHLTAIEPFPAPYLKEGFPNLSQLIESKVQEVDLSLFTALEAGDILFIDSTHALRAGGDVQWEYCEILPRLAPGVIVHIHDISLPKPYPRVYFEKNHFYWNEQYLLQAFLTFNSRFEVLWAGNYMMHKYPEPVCKVFPEFLAMREAFPQSEPSSFWMRVKS